jgi:conjugal transfer pilus assembly protein TraA
MTLSSKNLKNGMLLTFLAVAAGLSVAGGGGGEFQDVWDTIKDWTQGTLGMIIAGAMILVGVVAGVVRQSLMGFAVGFAGGMGLYNAPTVIEGIMVATLPQAETVNAVIAVTNGMM